MISSTPIVVTGKSNEIFSHTLVFPDPGFPIVFIIIYKLVYKC